MSNILDNTQKFINSVVDYANENAAMVGEKEADALSKRTFRVRITKTVGPVLDNQRALNIGEEFIAKPDSMLTLVQAKGNFTASLYDFDNKFCQLLHSSYYEIVKEL